MAVLTHTFVADTAEDLSDEEMEVTLCASHSDHTRSHFHLPDHSPCGPRCPTGLTLSRRTPLGETCRNHERDLSARHHAHRPTLSAGLAHRFLTLIAALASAIWPAIPAFFSHKGTLPSLAEWIFSCIHPRVLAPLLYRPYGTALSPLSPGGPTATSNPEATFVLFDPWSPHHSVLPDTTTGT